MKQQKKKGLLALVLLAVLAIALFTCYRVWKPSATEGKKTISVEVVYSETEKEQFQITTEEETLRGALEQEKLIEGEESQYGLFVKTVNGVTADEGNQEWWCFTKDGERLDTGVDTTMIQDKDQYEITLTVGY